MKFFLHEHHDLKESVMLYPEYNGKSLKFTIDVQLLLHSNNQNFT